MFSKITSVMSTNKFFLFCIYLNSLTFAVSSENQTYSVNDVEQCRISYDKKNLQEFPPGLGVGWDNLRNILRSEILNLTFSKCKLTADMQYLVPDGVQAIVVKTSHLNRMANYYDTYESYTESTSLSINLDESATIGHFGISGSFSEHSQSVKQHSLGEQSSIFRTKLEHHAYTGIVTPETPLNSIFRHRLLEVGEALLKNHTKLAKYLSQLIIRDYGTHVITNADVGAILVQEDFLDSKSLSDTKTNIYDVRAAAALSFFGVAKIGASVGRQVSSATVTQYQSMLRHSQYNAHGGPNVNRLLDSNATAPMEVDDLVVLDRSGTPIYFLITEDYLPSLPLPTIASVQSYLKNATEEYYKRNVVYGCQDREAENFNYVANVDDSSCKMPYNNYSFGGVYQTCNVISGAKERCDDFTVKNGITGQFKCPDGAGKYVALKLFQTYTTFPPRKESVCNQACHACGFLWLKKCCTTTCNDVFYIDEISLDAYWCSATEQVPSNSGYLFGGLFTSKMPNPFSVNQNCPGKFVPFKIGVDLSVCMSRDFQLDYESSVKFAGFFSCGKSAAVAQCAQGYSQHLAEIIDGCEIYYCVRPEAFSKAKLVNVNVPPYMNYPYEYEAFTVLQTYQDGRLWHRSSVNNKSWAMTRILQEGGGLPSHSKLLTEWNRQAVDNGSAQGVKGGLVAGIIFGCLAMIVLVSTVAYFIVKRHRAVRHTNYESIESS